MSGGGSQSQIYSQPALTGAGVHENTQLASAIDALKAHGNPVRLEDFALSHGLNNLLNPSSSLFLRFRDHDRVLHDPKTDLWSFKVRLPPTLRPPLPVPCADATGIMVARL